MKKFLLWYYISNKITRRMKLDLIEMGYSIEKIKHLTP